jgi:outer membrane protein TolC
MVDEALARYRSTVLDGFREVEDGLAALSRNQERLALAERTRERRRRARAVLDEQYRAGLVGLLNLLTAERDLADAEATAANARAQVTVDWIGLQKALGGGWQVVPAPEKETGA